MNPRLVAVILTVAFALVLAGLPASAQIPSHCVAIPLPSLRGAEGDTTQLATSLRDLVTTYFTGGSVRVIALDARLEQPALEEARQKTCATILTLTLTRKRSGGGGMGRVLGSAAGAAAWHVPYSGAASAAARSAAAAAADLASNTRAKDEWSLQYRLSSTEKTTTLSSGTEKKKADSDGEDVVTPLVEKMANVVYAAVSK